MFSPNLRNRNFVLLLAIVIVSFAALLLHLIGRKDDCECSLLTSMSQPGKNLLSGAGEGIKDFFVFLGSSSSMRKENETLKAENQRLSAELEQAKSFKDENLALRDLLELKKMSGGDSIPSEITGRDPTNWFERFELNRGKGNGITKNMIVTAPSGLVGQITSLCDGTSTVRTLINPRSAIPIYVVESGSFGILCGDGTPIATIRYIRNIALLSEGQLVVTSGLGDVFPSGIIVGRVTKVQGTVDGLSNLAKVKPFVNLETLKKVLVMRGKQ
jgi:rod shape-determining protein MreC